MVQVVSIATVKAKRTQDAEIRRAQEMLVMGDECERIALYYGKAASLKMIIGSWIAGTSSISTLPDNETAAMLEDLAKRFRGA